METYQVIKTNFHTILPHIRTSTTLIGNTGVLFRNALSLAMLDELKSQLVSGADTHSVKVIIIGHNGNVFSAGHDLKELVSGMFP